MYVWGGGVLKGKYVWGGGVLKGKYVCAGRGSAEGEQTVCTCSVRGSAKGNRLYAGGWVGGF